MPTHEVNLRVLVLPQAYGPLMMCLSAASSHQSAEAALSALPQLLPCRDVVVP